jgi:shikimate kinase
MLTFQEYLQEGVNDPAIFKAVFLAGGPGSGKSFIVGKTALGALGFRLINSDPAFEAGLKKAGLEATPEDIFTDKGQEVRAKAKLLTKKQLEFSLKGRLGVTIDGTGKDFDKIKKQVIAMRKLGYECAMIFVNTDLDTAIARDAKRDRSLGKEEVTKMWKAVQNNIGKFQNLMGRHMYIVDNSDGANFEGATQSVYKRIGAWSKETPSTPQAKAWMVAQKRKK